uniref:Uncharacterized protein n=1 Tax=Anguilla anguilla TaxID=7936 RepID=A0A0E9PU62_ANGAN
MAPSGGEDRMRNFSYSSFNSVRLHLWTQS